MGSSVQTFQCFALPSKHQSNSRVIINCSHPRHYFLHTLFWNFTEGMSVLSLYCNEKSLRNVWNWEHSIPKSSSSHRVWAVSRNDAEKLAESWRQIILVPANPSQAWETAESQPRQAQGNISQQGYRQWIKPHRKANNLYSAFLETPLGG